MADIPPMTALPATPPAPAPAAAPLSPAHYQQLALARQRFGKIRRASRFALFDGISTSVIAGTALLSSLAGLSLLGSLACLAVCGMACISLCGARLLRRADTRAASLLGLNQLALFAVVALYCVYSFYSPDSLGGQIAAALRSPEVREVLPDADRLAGLLPLLLYGLLFTLSFFCQGLAALYYFTRARHLRAYRQETPPWILQLQQTGALR